MHVQSKVLLAFTMAVSKLVIWFAYRCVGLEPYTQLELQDHVSLTEVLPPLYDMPLELNPLISLCSTSIYI